MNYCNRCGAKVSEDDLFCKNCGNRLEHGEPAAPAADLSAEADRPAFAGQPVVAQAPAAALVTFGEPTIPPREGAPPFGAPARPEPAAPAAVPTPEPAPRPEAAPVAAVDFAEPPHKSEPLFGAAVPTGGDPAPMPPSPPPAPEPPSEAQSKAKINELLQAAQAPAAKPTPKPAAKAAPPVQAKPAQSEYKFAFAADREATPPAGASPVAKSAPRPQPANRPPAQKPAARPTPPPAKPARPTGGPVPPRNAPKVAPPLSDTPQDLFAPAGGPAEAPASLFDEPSAGTGGAPVDTLFGLSTAQQPEPPAEPVKPALFDQDQAAPAPPPRRNGAAPGAPRPSIELFDQAQAEEKLPPAPGPKAPLFDQDTAEIQPMQPPPAPSRKQQAPLFDQDQAGIEPIHKGRKQASTLFDDIPARPAAEPEMTGLFDVQQPVAEPAYSGGHSGDSFGDTAEWGQPLPPYEAAPQEDLFEPEGGDTGQFKASMAASIASAAMEPTGPIPGTGRDAYSVQDLYDSASLPAYPDEDYRQPGRGQAPPPSHDPYYDEEPYEKPRRKGGALRVFVTVIVALVVFAAATLGVTIGVLYYLNRPAKTISDFAIALSGNDHEALADLSVVTGAQATDAGWTALSSAFSDAAALETLRAELESQAEGKAASQAQYPAITIVGEPLFLFIDRYTIYIHGVDLLAPGVAEGAVLRLNDADFSGAATADGLLVSGVMPGKYTCQIILADSSAQGAFEFTAFQTAAANVISQPASGSPVTVANCLSDDATIYLNGLEVPEKPVGGILSLPSVALGSEIRILVIQDGAGVEAAVTFSDPAQASLSFGEYVPTGTPPEDTPGNSTSETTSEAATTLTAAEIDPIITSFYSSYIQCANALDISGLTGATEAAKQQLGQNIGSDGNRANNFAFVSATCKPETITTSEENGVPIVTFEAQTTYNYWPRDGAEADAQAGGNNRTVTLVYQNGQWLVSNFATI